MKVPGAEPEVGCWLLFFVPPARAHDLSRRHACALGLTRAASCHELSDSDIPTDSAQQKMDLR
jgi:hypothetical protein